MSGNSEQVTTEQQTVQQLSHRRILVLMAAVVIIAVALGSAFVSTNFGIGVLIGGILSFINYFWLKSSLKNLFAAAVSGEKPRFLATKYLLRYAGFGFVLAIVYLTKTVPIVAVLLGLASFALAIIIEAFIRLFSSFFIKKEI